MTTDTINEATETETKTAEDAPTVDLSLYVRKIDILQTAKRLRKENDWCRTPLDAVAEMGVDESALVRPKLSSLPIGSVITQANSYSVYVWVKTTDTHWESTHSGAFDAEGEITDAHYVRQTHQGRNLPARFSVIYRPDGKYSEEEVPEAETDPSKVDLNDYVLKTEVLRVTMRYIAANPDTEEAVVAGLRTLGVDIPERVKAADLSVGTVASARSYELGNFNAVKTGEDEWSVTSWDAINRSGFLLDHGRFVRQAMTNAQLDGVKLVILHDPSGKHQS